MKDYSYVYNAHPTFIENMYKQYANDPTSVDEGWRIFFDGFEFASGTSDDGSSPTASSAPMSTKEFSVLSIIHGFRTRGHLLATTNPIQRRRDRAPHLDLSDYGLTESDLQNTFVSGEEIGLKNATLQQIIDKLNRIYCGNIGFEVSNIDDREKRMWLRSKVESLTTDNAYGFDIDQKKNILERLNDAVVFENFLHTKYVGQKRFSLEGGESAIVALDTIISNAANDGVKECIIGMAHRGRLNVLANIMAKTYEQIFNEFEGTAVPDMAFGDGDVKYHLGFSTQRVTGMGNKVDIKMVPNPSHLESVGPVVEGFARAKADIMYDSDYDKILPILIHGDAAVAGQGVVYETVQMSQLEGYYTGGTIHYIINNQIGFTTDFDDARSSTYCTAAASLVQAPVFHVNGDDPEAVAFVSQMAVEYRQKFNNDVFIDMVCYRKHGHNEGDDPKFTQPKMYDLISKHENPRALYVKILTKRGDLEKAMAEKLEQGFWSDLQGKLDKVKEHPLPYEYQAPEKDWRKLRTAEAKDFEKSPKTGITKKKIDQILEHLMRLPEEFTPLSKVNRLRKGMQKLLDAKKLDWAMAELMAYGTILLEGKNVRMSGQDVKRGTFSHRHAIFRDAKTYEEYNRLSDMTGDQGKFMIFNSLLSEFAVMGFEYGYSLASPNSLVIWEAQFGDFYNGAQTIVDQYIVAAESKWRRMSGLVLLLPHGYAGQGPEHSSARIERFLQQCAEYNITVTNLTTPANLFHALRRQIVRPFRKPMINMSPKSLLRHPLCVSDPSDFTTNSTFQEVIGDDKVTGKKAKRLLLCTGKVYYDLLQAREENKIKDVAIVRIEQLYPYPQTQIDAILKDYTKAEKYWVQEEPQNMGAWNFMLGYMRKVDIDPISRPASASPATGYKKKHDMQQAEIISTALGL